MLQLLLGILLGAIATSGSTPNHLRVRRAVVDGRAYRIVSRGPGTYEVFREGAPAVFVMLNQDGELATSTPSAELEELSFDMRQFPSRLFS